jgi:hypothetical protein
MPSGHTEHDTFERAISDGFSQGYKRVRKDMSPILKAAVAKARRSLPDPKTRAQAERRAALYDRFASAPGNRSAGGKARIAIAQSEAQYLRTKTGTWGELRGLQLEAAARRQKLEQQRSRAATSVKVTP